MHVRINVILMMLLLMVVLVTSQVLVAQVGALFEGMFGMKHTCQCKYSKIKWKERKREISKYVK